jgi:hypothetical protein
MGRASGGEAGVSHGSIRSAIFVEAGKFPETKSQSFAFSEDTGSREASVRMLVYLGIIWLGCAAIFLELADRAPLIEG